jgi:RNA polymerase sigma-70 factor (ECF subfamily)
MATISQTPLDTVPPIAAARDNDRDVELLRLVATGDHRAFQRIYDFYYGRLAAFLVRMTRQRDVAEEIINDTMWIVWQKAGQFRGEAKVSTWIIGIAYRRALTTLQRLNAGARRLNQITDADALTTAKQQHTEELHEWLNSALEQLPLEQRLVIELAYYLGHSCQEIATIMECPVNTVKTRMFHARHKLKRLLEGANDGT